MHFRMPNIEFVVQGESTLNMANVYATGLDGAHVQVAPGDKARATQVLKDLDIIPKFERDTSFGFIRQIEKFTNRIPVLNTVTTPFRILLIVFLIIAIPLLLYAWFYFEVI